MATPVVPERAHVPWTLAAILALSVAYAGLFFGTQHEHEGERSLQRMVVACGCSDGSHCTVTPAGHWPFGIRKRVPDGAFAVVRDDAGALFEVACATGRVQLSKLPAVKT